MLMIVVVLFQKQLNPKKNLNNIGSNKQITNMKIATTILKIMKSKT